MNVAEFLEHTKEYLDDSSSLIEGDPDTLWSDKLKLSFLRQGMHILCRRAWVIIDDANPTAGTIVLKTGVNTYPLHESVLRVYLAVPSDQDQPLGRFADIGLRTPHPFQDDEWPMDLVINPAFDAPGRPIGFATDAGTRILRVYRTPSATENGLKLYLKVARFPIVWPSLDDLDTEFEVPEDYHHSLCDYVHGRCLTQPNVDAQMKQDGRLMLQQFDEVVKEARRDRIRAEMNPYAWNFASTTAVLNERIR